MGLEEEVIDIPHKSVLPHHAARKASKIVEREEIKNFLNRQLTPKES